MKNLDKTEQVWVTIFITGLLFLGLSLYWVYVEKLVLGAINNNPVDNIVAFPIIISLWFNAKQIVTKLNR